jgi:hypothetical protein
VRSTAQAADPQGQRRDRGDQRQSGDAPAPPDESTARSLTPRAAEVGVRPGDRPGDRPGGVIADGHQGL